MSKSHLRLECYGTVDELNSVLGLLLSHMQVTGFDGTRRFLLQTQNHLFNLGSQLACADIKLAEQLPTILTQHILTIENQIDDLEKDLPKLKQFILPGGHLLASHAHLARTVCRRAERLCYALAEKETITPNAGPFLNRLNDYFFVLARFFNHHFGVAEITWEKS